MRLAEAEWMGLLERSGTRAMLREDGSLELYESEAEFEASLPGWAARRALRHRLPPYRSERAGRLAARPVAALHPRHFRARTGRRSADPEAARQGRSGPTRSARAPCLSRPKSSRRRGGWRALTLAAAPRAQSLRPPGRSPPAPGRICWPANSATASRWRPSAATTRRCRQSAFDVKRQLIFRGHGFVITPLETGLRVGGAVELGGLRPPAEFAALEGDAGKGKTLPAGLDPAAGANGWAFVRRCRIRCR